MFRVPYDNIQSPQNFLKAIAVFTHKSISQVFKLLFITVLVRIEQKEFLLQRWQYCVKKSALKLIYVPREQINVR